jgi:predicted molibdopterin-dependent oxidoreductase YjgC
METKSVQLKIDGQVVKARPGISVLQAAREAGLYIPALCELEGLLPGSSCRLCLIKIKDRLSFVPACATQAEEGMEVMTSSEELEKLRQATFELILSEHPYFCLLCGEKADCDELKVTMSKAFDPGGCVFCPKDGDCDLQRVASYLRIKKVTYKFKDRGRPQWLQDPFISHNPNLCILCGRCVSVCGEIRGENVLTFVNRGPSTAIGTFYNRPLKESNCSFCCACLDVCPTGAMLEKGLLAVKDEKLKYKSFICPLCGCGCELETEIEEDGTCRRVLPSKKNQPAFLSGCLRGRFGGKELVAGSLYVDSPSLRTNDGREKVSLEQAIPALASRLKQVNPEETALVFSESAPVENLLAFIQLGQALGVENIFWYYPENFLTRLNKFGQENQLSFDFYSADPAKPLTDECFFIVDSDLKSEAVTLWLEIKKQLRAGARMIVLDGGFNSIEGQASLKLKPLPGREYLALLSILRLWLDKANGLKLYPGFEELKEKLNGFEPEDLALAGGLDLSSVKAAVDLLAANKPRKFIFGQRLLRSESWKENLLAVWNLSLAVDGQIFPLSSKINERFLAGLAASRKIKIIDQLGNLEDRIREKKIKNLYVYGDLPLREKPEFLAVQNIFLSRLGELSDLFLPASFYPGESGHFLDYGSRLKASSDRLEQNKEQRSDLEVFNRLRKELGISEWPAPKKNIIEDSLQEASSISGRKLGRRRYIWLEDMARKTQNSLSVMNWKPAESAAGEFIIIIDQNLDLYSGLELPEEVPGYSQARNPDLVLIHPDEASRLELKAGQEITIRVENKTLRGQIKPDFGLRPGVLVIRPLITDPFLLELYHQGAVRGTVELKNE